MMNKKLAMKRNQIILSLAIVLLVLNLVGITAFYLKKPTKIYRHKRTERSVEERHQKFESRMAKKLNLNAEQLEEFRNLKQQHMLKIQPLKDSIRQHKWLIHQELFNELPDTLYINALSDSIGKMNAAFEKLNYAHFIQLKKILNQDQLDSFKQVLDDLPYKQNRHHERSKRDRPH